VRQGSWCFSGCRSQACPCPRCLLAQGQLPDAVAAETNLLWKEYTQHCSSQTRPLAPTKVVQNAPQALISKRSWLCRVNQLRGVTNLLCYPYLCRESEAADPAGFHPWWSIYRPSRVTRVQGCKRRRKCQRHQRVAQTSTSDIVLVSRCFERARWSPALSSRQPQQIQPMTKQA